MLAFHENKFARPERLVRLIAESRGQMKVRPDHKVVLLRETKSPVERLRTAQEADGRAGAARGLRQRTRRGT